jgi:hypothetical protein
MILSGWKLATPIALILPARVQLFHGTHIAIHVTKRLMNEIRGPGSSTCSRFRDRSKAASVPSLAVISESRVSS